MHRWDGYTYISTDEEPNKKMKDDGWMDGGMDGSAKEAKLDLHPPWVFS